jgi:hypothetical protein
MSYTTARANDNVGVYGNWVVARTALPDCYALGTAGVATTMSSTGMEFNFGFKVEAYVTGSAGYSFVLKGKTMNVGTNIPGKDLVPERVFDPLTVTVAGILISATPSLRLAILDTEADSKWAGAWQLSSSMSATAKLGGYINWPSVWDGTKDSNGNWRMTSPTSGAYTDFAVSAAAPTFTRSALEMTSLTITVPIAPIVTLRIFNAFPVRATIAINNELSFQKQQRRLLGGPIAPSVADAPLSSPPPPSPHAVTSKA